MMADRVFTAKELVTRLGGDLQGEGGDIPLSGCAALADAEIGHIAFLASSKYKNDLSVGNPSVVIVRSQDASLVAGTKIIFQDPQLYFARVLRLFHPAELPAPGIHPSAIIAEGAYVHPTAQIDAFVHVESGAVIGPGCMIGSGCFIGRNAVLGADVRLFPRVVVYERGVIGDRTLIHAGAVIGADGFGNAWSGDHWEKIPQIGTVKIGCDVEIGANTTVDRGAASDTIISDGVRIDNLVQIAHNVVIGRHTAIAACVGIAGSTQIGANCLIGGGCKISGHLRITDRVVLLGDSGVGSDILEAGVYGSGLPAIPHSAWLRNTVHWRNLDGFAKSLKKIEKSLNDNNESGSEK